MDMEAPGADWYVWSAYKVYGPHMAALFGRRDAIDDLEGPNHFFITRPDVPYRFEAGGVLHESGAGLLALRDHLCLLASLEVETDVPSPAGIDRRTVERAFAVMTAREIASHVHRRGIGIRHGHMYAWRLCSALGIPPEDGVVPRARPEHPQGVPVTRCPGTTPGARRASRRPLNRR